MRSAVIVSTARTPIGRAYRGAFNNTPSPTLASHSIRAAVERAGIDPAEVDDVVFGCALQGTQLIEASAGTGKTWNLCGLYLRLLLERGMPVAEILVVTFTNAATAELRERIRARIAEALARLRGGAAPSADPFTDELLQHLRARPGHRDADIERRLESALHGFDEAAIQAQARAWIGDAGIDRREAGERGLATRIFGEKCRTSIAELRFDERGQRLGEQVGPGVVGTRGDALCVEHCRKAIAIVAIGCEGGQEIDPR